MGDPGETTQAVEDNLGGSRAQRVIKERLPGPLLRESKTRPDARFYRLRIYHDEALGQPIRGRSQTHSRQALSEPHYYRSHEAHVRQDERRQARENEDTPIRRDDRPKGALQ